MFRFAKERIVWWPVTIKAPAKDRPGHVEEFAAKIRVQLLDMDEIKQYVHGAPESDTELLVQKISDWEDIADESGKALAFTADNLRALLSIPYVRGAFAGGLLEASSGRAAVKN